MFVDIRRLLASFAAVALALVLFLTGCSGSELTPPPLDPATYQASWLLVPVHPNPDHTESPQSDLRIQYESALDETKTALDSYGQMYSIYADAPSHDVGISADSIYMPNGEGEGDRAQRLNPAVIRDIAGSTSEDFIFVMDPHKAQSRFYEPGIGVGGGVSPSGGITVNVIIPRVDSVKVTDRYTIASLFDTRSPSFTDLALSPTPTWIGLRPLTPLPYPSFGDEPEDRHTGFNARSIVLYLMTGLEVENTLFELKDRGSVIIYRHKRPTVRGRKLRVESVNFVVEDEGQTVRVPIHQVSSIKSTSRNEVIYKD